MKKESKIIWGINSICIAFLLLSAIPCHSQYIYSHSDNYEKFKDNSSFKYYYKVESEYNESWIYYEMGTEKNTSGVFDIKIVDITGKPLPYVFLNIIVGEYRSLVFSDSYGVASITLPEKYECIEINFQARKKYLLIYDNYLPSKMTVMYGAPPINTFLNIRSKKQLCFEQINKIRAIVSSGGDVNDDSLYYYYSGE